MFNLEEFAKTYYSAFRDIVSALPSTESIPNFLKDTSFVIACSDASGRVAIDIISRYNIKELIWNGQILSPQPVEEPGFLIAPNLQSIEQIIFPQDDKRTAVSTTISIRYVILDGLAFSNKEYNDKYWSDANFYRNCAGSIPFQVKSTGSMLGLNILWGAELCGQRQERLFEYIKIYGNRNMLPMDSKVLQDEVFRDFAHATSKLFKKLDNWSFTDFLNGLKEPVERNVLLLGSYKSENEFSNLKTALKQLGYNGFLLKDSPDLPIQSNLEKLFSAIICSSFIIVLDKEASGHIAELSHMLQFRFRPVIVVRETDKPTTAFIEDRILTDSYFRIAVLKDITTQSLLPYIKWAKEIINKQINSFNEINHWRKK